MTKTWKLAGAGVAVAVAVAAGVFILRGKGGEPPPVASGQPVEVPLQFTAREVASPVMRTLPLAISFSGGLVAPDTATARAKEGGTLVALGAVEGSRVKAGQSLGRIDLADLATRVAERQALLAQAQAQMGQAERNHASNQQLAQQNFISPVALQTSEAELEGARAQRDAARAVLEATRIGLRDAELRAPIDGIVAKRHAVAGERLTADQPVFTIVNLARLELAGTVPTHEISRLMVDMPVQVLVEGATTPVTGKLARIAPAAETGTRSIGVAVTIPNADERLRGGQYAVATVVLDDPQQRMTVPMAALGTISGQEHVWVIDGGVLARRAVTTGRRDVATAQVEVLSGLTAGAQVLSTRFDGLREGRKASVLNAAGQPGGAAVASAAASSALR